MRDAGCGEVAEAEKRAKPGGATPFFTLYTLYCMAFILILHGTHTHVHITLTTVSGPGGATPFPGGQVEILYYTILYYSIVHRSPADRL